MATGGSDKISIDPSDALFLHPSDHPGSVLVADVFNGEDFEKWRRSVTIALSAKNKIAFVDGSSTRPGNDSPLLPYWKRCNDMILSWLLNSVSKNIRDSILFCETASEVWRELGERYGQSNKARLFQAQKEVSCLSQDDLDIASYFNKAKKLWDEFSAASISPRCSCGKCKCDINSQLQGYFQEQKLIQFLMGLNESNTHVRGNILMMTPLPTLSQTYSLLVQEERQRQVRTGSRLQGEGMSFNINTGNLAPNNGQRRQEGRKSGLFCSYCKRKGHTIDKCYKLHGFPGSTRQGSNSKVFRNANNVCGMAEAEEDSSKNSHEHETVRPAFPLLPGLDQEQTKQLVQFLGQLTNRGEHKDSLEKEKSSYMAGPFTEEATGHW